jgi:hypothetical protein
MSNLGQELLYRNPLGHLLRTAMNGPMLIAALALVVGCSGPRKLSAIAPARQQRSELDAQLANVFTNALLFKPAPGEVDALSWKLAPLIMQEVATPQTDFKQDELIGLGITVVGPTRPAVFALQGDTLIDGQIHAQVTYVWGYARDQSPPGAFLTQGVRMTLNSAGEPVIWEPLTIMTNVRVLFIAESLEKAATEQYGPPLPGRRYAVENSIDQQAQIVVARVIDDGPIAMGPIVYVQTGTRAVTTVLCRCMPAQVSQVVGTREYQLRRLETLGDLSAWPSPWADAWARIQMETAGALPSSLRLPRRF